ncbi:TetR family transcriptional regulator [Bradyrhizobium jicamae]|uniref:TetR family transcriptional regulator n=1 Tax=Bradyrhizobium jicamae TaxID=280332 RepID=UPI00390CD019
MQERMRQVEFSCIRRRIVQAAIRLHREIGFKKTTVADIARGASMSPANSFAASSLQGSRSTRWSW